MTPSHLLLLAIALALLPFLEGTPSVSDEPIPTPEPTPDVEPTPAPDVTPTPDPLPPVEPPVDPAPPAEPAPEPVPADPVPIDPVPIDPVPIDPAPTPGPGPVEPAPAPEPMPPVEPAPVPAPTPAPAPTIGEVAATVESDIVVRDETAAAAKVALDRYTADAGSFSDALRAIGHPIFVVTTADPVAVAVYEFDSVAGYKKTLPLAANTPIPGR